MYKRTDLLEIDTKNLIVKAGRKVWRFTSDLEIRAFVDGFQSGDLAAICHPSEAA